MERVIEFLKKNTLAVYGILILVSCVFLFFNNNYTFFWYDEGFSLSLIKHSYGDIWSLTAQDVHPPLYYFLLKIYASIAGESILNMRFFSAVPILLTVLVVCTIIRKEWGNKTAIFFLLLLLLTPATKYMASEIRMYSWAMFFVLMTFVYGYLSFTREKRYYFLLFLLFSLMAAYTHYFALITVFFIYVVFFGLSLMYNRKKLLLFFIVSALFILGYTPWLIILWEQMKTVKESYWITPDLWKYGLLENIYPVGKLRIKSLSDNMIFGLRLLLLVAFFTYCFFLIPNTQNKRAHKRVAVAALILFVLPALFTILYTILVTPVFYYRYVCCFIGLYILGAAVLFSALDFSRRASQIVVFLFFGLSFYLNISLYKHAYRDNRADAKLQDAMLRFVKEDIDEHTAFLYTDSVYGQLAIYPILFPENAHICKINPVSGKNRTVIDVFNITKVSSFENIDEKYNKLYILDHCPAGETNLMQIAEDSAQIVQQFYVSRIFEEKLEKQIKPTRGYEFKRRIINDFNLKSDSLSIK